MKKYILTIFLAGVFSLGMLSLLGCGKKQPASARKIVAMVNQEAIYDSDLQKEMELNAVSNPLAQMNGEMIDRQLQLMIDKRLLIQEAKRNKLDEKDKFIRTIKLFWEQTLIRDLADFKRQELEKTVSVSDAEIKNYHDQLFFRATFDILRTKDKAVAEKLLSVPAEAIRWDEEIGPIAFEDASTGMIVEAFALPEGEKKIVQQGGDYYLILMKSKQALPQVPLEVAREQIRKKILDRKVQRMFKDWLEKFKQQAKITLDEEALKQMRYENA
ncbi:MAG: SurA N-terminal domain-containing protein [Candidatus Omnitrophica bacterium]|nr:SurA N-terminal domain-containing protein [Candidatus Omnitrophota bacterium]MDD5671545.1 SurA N-terminal domain-containing protein [Candidatus Omnitrophota bacterium]